MKVVDIADEIFRELSEPSTLSIPAIAYWVRSNVGELNNYLNTSFRVSHSTFEIEESVDVTGRQPVSFNSAVDNSTLELQFEEKAVLKKMYNIAEWYIGKTATFTYFQRTPSGSYRHPLFKTVRNYE